MKKVLSALAIGSLLFLSACDTGVAAQIGDTKISQNTVQEKITEILRERQGVDTSQMQLSIGEELNRSELRFLLISDLFKKIADESGIVITQAMKDAKKASLLSQVGGEANLRNALVNAQIAPSDLDTYIQSILISEDLTAKLKASGIAETQTGVAVQQLVLQTVKKLGLKINPVYGAWDPTNADLVAFDAAGSAVKATN